MVLHVMVTSDTLIGNLTFITSSLLMQASSACYALEISRMQCGNLLYHGGTWEESLFLNGPNAAGVYVAGSEPV